MLRLPQRRSMYSSLLLTSQLCLESVFPINHIALIALWIHKHCGSSPLHPCIFLCKPVIGAMRAKEDVAMQRLQRVEGVFVVGGNLRILHIVDQLVAGIDVG